MCACLCVVLPPGLPYTPGLSFVPWGGHPDVHLALGPLGFVPPGGGKSLLPSTQTHGSSSLKPEVRK